MALTALAMSAGAIEAKADVQMDYLPLSEEDKTLVVDITNDYGYEDYKIVVPETVDYEATGEMWTVKQVGVSSLNTKCGYVHLTLPATVETISSSFVGPGQLFLHMLGEVPPTLDGVSFGYNVIVLSHAGAADAYREAWGGENVTYVNGSHYVDFDAKDYYYGGSEAECLSGGVDADSVVVTVKPAFSYSYTIEVDGDTVVGTSIDTASYSVPIGDYSYVVVDFEPIFYKIAYESNASEQSGVLAGPEHERYGEDVLITAQPSNGYQVDVAILDAKGDTLDVTVDRDYRRLTMPASDMVVHADFKPIDYTVTAETTFGRGTVEVASTAHAGDTVFFSVTPAEGYTLHEISGNVSLDSASFVMPARDVVLNAVFVADRSVRVLVVKDGVVIAEGDTVVADLSAVGIYDFAMRLDGISDVYGDYQFASASINGKQCSKSETVYYSVEGRDVTAVMYLVEARPLNLVMTLGGDTLATETVMIVPGEERSGMSCLDAYLYTEKNAEAMDSVLNGYETYYRKSMLLNGETFGEYNEWAGEFIDNFVMPDAASTLLYEYARIRDISVDFALVFDGDTVAQHVFEFTPNEDYLDVSTMLDSEGISAVYASICESGNTHFASLVVNGEKQSSSYYTVGGYEDLSIVYEMKTSAVYPLTLAVFNADGSKDVEFVLCNSLSGSYVSVVDSIWADDILEDLQARMDTVSYSWYVGGKETYYIDEFMMPDSATTVELHFADEAGGVGELSDLTVNYVCDGDTIMSATLEDFYAPFTGICYTCPTYYWEDIRDNHVEIDEEALLEEHYGDEPYSLSKVTINDKDVTDEWNDYMNLDMSLSNMTITVNYVRGLICKTQILVASAGDASISVDKSTVMTGDTVRVTVTMGDTVDVESIGLRESPSIVFERNGRGAYSFVMPYMLYATIDASFVAFADTAAVPTDTTAVPVDSSLVTYTVSVAGMEIGSVSVDKTEVQVGDTVAISVVIPEGYEIETLTVNGEALEVSADGKATYIVEEGDIVVLATFRETSALHVVSAQGLEIAVDGREISVGGAGSFEVYDLMGRKAATGLGGKAVVGTSGVYIVVANCVGSKVVVR